MFDRVLGGQRGFFGFLMGESDVHGHTYAPPPWDIRGVPVYGASVVNRQQTQSSGRPAWSIGVRSGVTCTYSPRSAVPRCAPPPNPCPAIAPHVVGSRVLPTCLRRLRLAELRLPPSLRSSFCAHRCTLIIPLCRATHRICWDRSLCNNGPLL